MNEPLATLFEAPELPTTELPEPLRHRFGGDLGFNPETAYANFVSSVDGVVAIDPETPPSVLSGKSDTDRFVMGLLRAFAEAVVVGAGTLRAEPRHLWTPGHIYPDMTEPYAELRESLGLDPEPRLVLLSRRGDLDPSLPAFDRGALVLTTEEAASRLRRVLPASSKTMGLQEDRLTVPGVLEVVRSEGHHRVLTEGGPTVLGGFLRDGVLDELFLTLSPRIAGREPGDQRLGLVEKFSLPPSALQSLTLLSAKQDGSHLFLRYGVDR